MDLRQFGNTNLKVSAIGYGAGQIGDLAVEDSKVEKILNTALDNGINLIDTARGYFASEDRIGKFVSHRRDEFVLSTKVGYDVEGEADWSYSSVIIGIEDALKKMKTDYIDIVHLHSCSLKELQKGEAAEALIKAKADGKIHCTAYSGENEELEYAINSNQFDSIQTSFNICDQSDLYHRLPLAKEKGLGLIAKRPLANAPWRFAEQPAGHYCEDYWLRLKQMNLDLGIDLHEIALRFSAFTWGIDSIIIGTTNIDHLLKNLRLIEKGKLPQEIIDQITNSFRTNDNNWIGLV